MANLRITVWLVTVRSSLGSTIVVDDVAVAADSIWSKDGVLLL